MPQDMSAGGSDEDASSPITNEQTKGARVRLHLVAHSRQARWVQGYTCPLGSTFACVCHSGSSPAYGRSAECQQNFNPPPTPAEVFRLTL